MQQEVYDRLTRAGDTETEHAALLLPPHTLGDDLRRGPAGDRHAQPVARQRRPGDGGIAGAFSGTLGFVMSGLQVGQPFSVVVREAHRGWATPNLTRDDLGRC